MGRVHRRFTTASNANRVLLPLKRGLPCSYIHFLSKVYTFLVVLWEELYTVCLHVDNLCCLVRHKTAFADAYQRLVVAYDLLIEQQPSPTGCNGMLFSRGARRSPTNAPLFSQTHMKRYIIIGALLGASLLSSGCVDELTRLKEKETRDIASGKIPDPYARINRYLELHSVPEGALVEINGITQGRTPLKVNVQVSPNGGLWDNQDITFIPVERGQYQQYRHLQGAPKPWDLYGIEQPQSTIPQGASITVSMYLHFVSN